MALAGPGASLVVTLLMFLLWQRTGGLLHEAVFLVAVNAAGLTAFNMLPLSLLEDRQPDAKRVTLDGYQAIYALVGPPPAERGSCDVSPPGFPPVRAGSRGASSGARG